MDVPSSKPGDAGYRLRAWHAPIARTWGNPL